MFHVVNVHPSGSLKEAGSSQTAAACVSVLIDFLIAKHKSTFVTKSKGTAGISLLSKEYLKTSAFAAVLL